MNPFIQQLVEDLKAFSAELLAPGLQGTQQVSGGMGTVASTAALLKSISFLTSLIPQLVEELQMSDATHKVMLHYTTMPKRAVFSRRASDYQLDEDRGVLPAHWLSVLPVPEMDVRPLRWLVYLLELQEVALAKVRERTTKFIDNSLLTQQGKSSYAENDRATLLNMRLRLNEAQTKLENARVLLLRMVQIKLVPSPHIPHPYPRSPAWNRLRRYAQQLIHPQEYLPSFLHNLLYGTLEIADTPYLYQRWCGVKLLSTFESMGWVWYEDPVGALFLGGEILVHKQEVTISMWVEPRFSSYRGHPSGFTCRHGFSAETHPDYLIVTPGPSGVDAFILDPTTTADTEIRRGKSKYLTSIERIERAIVAGRPVVRNPLRAWSAAPLHEYHCELFDGDIPGQEGQGRTGTIPMHPLDWAHQPLTAWIKDINDYALAWGKFSS